MAKVNVTLIGMGLAGFDKAVLRRYLWKETRAVATKRFKYSRDELKALPSYSQFAEAADAWNALSDEVKQDWDAAADVIGYHGYNLFIQDKIYRIMNGLEGNAEPSLYHQYLVGHLHIPEGAGDVLLRQTGNVRVTFPAILEVHRKTILTANSGDGGYVKIRFSYTYNEGSGEQTQTDEVSLTLSSPWFEQPLNITQHFGVLPSWTLEIEAHAVSGDLYWDDLMVQTPTGIIGNDPYCFDVAKYWSKIIFPESCILESIYPTDDAL